LIHGITGCDPFYWVRVSWGFFLGFISHMIFIIIM
jgi:hypothetical protein